MKRPFRSRGTAAVLALAMAAAFISTATPASASHRTTHVVHPGESIQRAINAANPGDKIKLSAGTFHQNVYVNKDFIELEGSGAHETFLLPPRVATPNPCVMGGDIFGAVCVGLSQTPVAGFELEGMTITGFSNGAFLVNTTGAEVSHVVFADNQAYGAFYNSSTGGHIHDNVAYGSGEAGLYIGDSANADVRIDHNEVYDNGNGLFLRDAANGVVESNHAHDNCFGILLLDTDQPTVPTNWRVRDNLANHNTRACPAGDDGPATSGGGIILAGASGNVVRHNDVNDNVPSGPSPVASGGIALVSTTDFGGSPSSNNVVRNNDLHGNQLFDLSDDGLGTGNTVHHNDCTTSQPPGLCDS